MDEKPVAQKGPAKTEQKAKPAQQVAVAIKTVWCEIHGYDMTSEGRAISLVAAAKVFEGDTMLRNDALQLGRMFKQVTEVSLFHLTGDKNEKRPIATGKPDPKEWAFTVKGKKDLVKHDRTIARTGKAKERVDFGPDVYGAIKHVLVEAGIASKTTRESTSNAVAAAQATIAVLKAALKAAGMTDDQIEKAIAQSQKA